jgi:hypothetical protein
MLWFEKCMILHVCTLLISRFDIRIRGAPIMQCRGVNVTQVQVTYVVLHSQMARTTLYIMYEFLLRSFCSVTLQEWRHMLL